MNHEKQNFRTRNKIWHVLFYSLLLLLIQVNAFSQNPSANIDQGNNGKASSPNDPVTWVNGDLNTTKTHYLEGQSIPYRIILDNLPLNTPVTVRIGFDLRESGHFAIDYLTSYDWTAQHEFIYKHPKESVNETLALGGTFNGTVYAPLPNPGKKNSPAGWSTQPEASFNNVLAQGKTKMALKNASFVSDPAWVVGKEPNFSEAYANYEVQMDVVVSASALPVVLSFGGHIASRFDWGTLPNLQARSAGGVSGAPYHMRVIQLMFNGTTKSIGNQDRSLQVEAPDCNNLALLISNQQNLLCNGTGAGSVTLATSGGNPGFQFSIDTGKTYQFSNVFSGLAPGSYQFLVRDTIGCVSPISTTITQPPVISSSGIKTNVICYGAKMGAIDLSVSGGTPGYTYLWSNGAITQDLSELSVGTYSVIITDANSCIKKDTFQITGPASGISTSGVVTNILCHEEHNGAIDLTVSGGSPGYTYAWSNGATTQDINTLQAGVYDVLVTDASGCNKRDTFTVTQPSSPLDMTFEHTDVLCYGNSTGSIDMSVTGGTPGYTYLWSNGKTTEDLSNLIAGFYNVLVTDANGCTKRDTVQIVQPEAALSIKHSKVDILCFGQATGSIDISVSGGSPGYSFAWSNGANTEDLSELIAGTYSVIATDKAGCIIKDTITITQPSSALVVSGKVTNILCHEVHSGAIDLTVSGGTASYTIQWSSGETSEDLSGLQAGVYDVLVTDANGCTKRDTFTISQPASPLDMTFEHVDIKCYGDSTGSINMIVSGGTPGYTYLWSNGKTTEDLSDLKAGFFDVLVTDANGCIKRDTVEIVQPTQLKMKYSSQDVLCYSDNTGSIQISVVGGSPDYTYQWSNGSTERDQYNLVAGIYSLIVTDIQGCVLKDTFNIKQPDKGLSIKATVKDLDCYGVATGAIDITVEGGTGAYVFEWSNAATSEDLSNIAAGIYSVKVTDENLCFVRDTFEVNQPDPLVVNADDKKVCAGVAVDLTASPSGGVWSGSGVSGSSFMMVAAGVYPVYYTYTNGNGCVGKDTAYVTVERCGDAFCTYTQGYYGNAGGKSCAEGMTYTTKSLMQKALSKGSIVLGVPALNRTFTINYNSVDTLIAILPGGGTPTMLGYTGDRTPSKLPSSMLKNGKINNVLLSQTITLALNIRINSELDSFKVRADKFLMTQDKVSCESKDLKECSYHSYKFSSKVVTALAGNKTISDLLKLANNALAGSLPAGLSYSDIVGAVDLVNNAFDGCKVGWYSDTVVYCPSVSVSSSASNMSASEQAVQMSVDPASKQPSVKAYPNPFEDIVRFTIESPERIQCNLMLYTSSGKLISKVFDGILDANVSKTVQAVIPSIYKEAIVYVLSYNGQVVTGKILKK